GHADAGRPAQVGGITELVTDFSLVPGMGNREAGGYVRHEGAAVEAGHAADGAFPVDTVGNGAHEAVVAPVDVRPGDVAGDAEDEAGADGEVGAGRHAEQPAVHVDVTTVRGTRTSVGNMVGSAPAVT